MTARQVVRLVAKHLENRRFNGVPIEVVASGVQREGTWWYVPVRPNLPLRGTWRFFEVLTDVEDDVKRELGDKGDVLLVPSG